jgi:hypothetical protein
LIYRKGLSVPVWAGGLLATAMLSPAAHAGFVFGVGASGTSYGVTNYCCGPIANPQFIPNNVTTPVTGRNDILASPGGGYQLANPVIANNIASYGPLGYPNYSFQVGGANGKGLFGSAFTLVTPTAIGFTISDSGPAGGSASYAITSTDNTFVTDAGGFNGTIGGYLGIAGVLPAGGSAIAVSMMTEISVDDGGFQYETAMILAMGGNGNNVAAGDQWAFVNTSAGFGGNYVAVSIDNWGLFNLAGPGHTIRVVNTITEIADPASIDSIAPDLTFLDDHGLTLPNLLLESDAAGTPEPGVLLMVGSGLLVVGLTRRRKRA